MTTSYRDHMIMWAKDVGRSVDYLESRPDIAKDEDRIDRFEHGAQWRRCFSPSSRGFHSA